MQCVRVLTPCMWNMVVRERYFWSEKKFGHTNSPHRSMVSALGDTSVTRLLSTKVTTTIVEQIESDLSKMCFYSLR